MKGIDVSIFQGHIDFKKVKASGIEVVIIKATQGTGYTNAMLAEHYKGARESGLKIGFYHYLTKDNPTIQAKQFLSVIDGLVADCKYVIDVEGKWTIDQASKATREFANYLISKGKEPCIYTGDYFYRDNLNSTVKDLPVWIANYGGSVLAKKYVGLQYSEKGSVNGVIGNVDLDTFNDGILLTKAVNTVANKMSKEDRTKYIVTEFQKFYNNITQTSAPLTLDGYGPKTQKAYETLGKLIKGEY